MINLLLKMMKVLMDEKSRIENQINRFLIVVFDKYKEDVKIMMVQLWCGGLKVMTN